MTRRPRRDPAATERALRAESHARRERTDAAWLVAADAWEEAGDLRRASQARNKARGPKDEARYRRGRLFYEMTDDEAGARQAMADVLTRQIGAVELGRKLARWPSSQRLGGTLLHEKIRRAIFGPERRQSYAPRKPERKVLLVRPSGRGPRSPYTGWVRVDRWHIDDPSAPGFFFAVPIGYTSATATMLVLSRGGAEDAAEIAEEQWPHLMLDEIDPEDAEQRDDAQPHPTQPGVWVVPTLELYMDQVRNRDVRWGRIVGHDEAFIRGVGVVRFSR